MRPVFTPRIDAGHILQAVVIAVGAVVYITTVGGQVGEANRKIDDLKTAITEVGAKIVALPDYAARLSQAERRISDEEARVTAIDGKHGNRLDELTNRITRDEIAAAAFESRLTRLEGASGPVRNPH